MGLRLSNQYQNPYYSNGPIWLNSAVNLQNQGYGTFYNNRSGAIPIYSPLRPSFAFRGIISDGTDPVAGETITLPLLNGTLQAFTVEYAAFSGNPFTIQMPATPTAAQVVAAIMASYLLWRGVGAEGINLVASATTDQINAIARSPGIVLPTITEAMTGLTLTAVSASARSTMVPGIIGKKFCYLPGRTLI